MNYKKYMLKEVNGRVERIEFDFYDISNALDCSEEVKHTLKKLWRTEGSTGNKTRSQDLRECINQINKEIHRLELKERFDSQNEYTDQQTLKNSGTFHFDLSKKSKFAKQFNDNRLKRLKAEQKLDVNIHDFAAWSKRFPEVGVYHVDLPFDKKNPPKACDFSYDLPKYGYKLIHDNSVLIETVRKWKNEIR